MSTYHREAIELVEEESKRKKRKMGSSSFTRDPRSLPASSLDLDSFKYQFPLIEVCTRDSLKGKFSISEFMDVEALECFTSHIFATLEASKGVWYGQSMGGGELASRPLHLILFGCICKLSKSYSVFKKSKKLNQEDVQKKIEDEQQRGEIEDNEAGTTITHLQVRDNVNPQTSGGQDSTSSESSTEGSIFNHEGSCPKGIPDIMVKTFCKRFLKEKQLDPTSQDTVIDAIFKEKLRTKAIIELKEDEQVSLLFYLFRVYGVLLKFW